MADRSFSGTLDAIVRVINANSSFIVLEHEKPDGDCIGSGLALVQALHSLGKKALLVSQDPHPAIYDFLPGRSHHTRAGCLDPGTFSADVAIFVDCADAERAGNALEFTRKKLRINIDHHISNTLFGHINMVDPGAAAAGQLVYSILKRLGVEISPDLATCLYVAIMTDTGGFRYQTTTQEVFELASLLIGKGANGSKIAERVFETRSFSSLLLLGSALSTIELYHGGKVATATVTKDMLKKTGATLEETEGIIEYPRSIAGVWLSLLFKEDQNLEKVHVSFRSREQVNVAELADLFGGGGHPRAAGATIEGSMKNVVGRVLEAVDGLNIWMDS